MNAWRRLRQFLKTDLGLCLVVAVVWQLALTLIGWVVAGGTPLSHISSWDGGWYFTITHDWYQTNAPSAALYPLFPLLASTVHFVSFGVLSLDTSGLIINTIALWLGLVALTRIAPYFVAKQYRYIPVLFILATPAAFFMHLFYTEAVFFCISAWAYLLALRRNWWAMGAALAFLTACRLPAVLIVALCGLEYLRTYGWNARKALNRHAFAFLLAPLGFIVYGCYLANVRSDFFAMFSAYHASDDWVYQVFDLNILHTLGRVVCQPLRAMLGMRDFDQDLIVNHLVPLCVLIILAAASLYAIINLRNRFLPLGIAGLLSIVMFSLNSNVVSAHRYALPCLIVYIVGVYLFEKYQKTHPYILAGVCLSFAMQAFLYISLLHGEFAG